MNFSQIKQIKNAIIGNNTKKAQHITDIPILTDILSKKTSNEIQTRTEAAIVLASLAQNQTCNLTMKTSVPNLKQALLDTLLDPNVTPELATPVARAIKLLYTNLNESCSQLVQDTLLNYSTIYNNNNSSSSNNNTVDYRVIQAIASIIPQATTPNFTYSPQVSVFLLRVLTSPNCPISLLEACLHALSCLQLTDTTTSAIVPLLKHSRSSVRVLASDCIADESVLSIVISLFSDNSRLNIVGPTSTVQQKALKVYIKLVSQSEQLQRQAFDSDVIQILQTLIEECTKFINTNMSTIKVENILSLSLDALAATSSKVEQARVFICKSKILSTSIIDCLKQRDSLVLQSSSCLLTKSLTRSVKCLRTFLSDLEIHLPLIELVDRNSIMIETNCSRENLFSVDQGIKALCNIILDFSPMKNIVCDKLLERFGQLSQLSSYHHDNNNDNNNSNDNGDDISDNNNNNGGGGLGSVKTSSLWALKNLSYKACINVKRRILSIVTFNQLINLRGENLIQGIAILRNLLCCSLNDGSFIDEVIDWCGGDNILAEKLEEFIVTPGDIGVHAIYCLVNIATNPKYVHVVTFRILVRIKELLTCGRVELRDGLVWVLVNFLWKDDDDNNDDDGDEVLEDVGSRDKFHERVNIVRESGIASVLDGIIQNENHGGDVPWNDRAQSIIELVCEV